MSSTLLSGPMRPRLPWLLLAMLLAGCGAPAVRPAGTTLTEGSLAFVTSTLTTKDGPGFEPSIAVAPDGTVYVAAAKTARPNSGARLADWLWYSQDGGATWRDMPSTGDAHKLMPGLEGDVAVDGKGRLYYADTWGPDLTLSRWAPGPTWDWSRPVMPNAPPFDDRPFLAAHGDGHVYLLSNTAAPGGAILLSRSSDGGLSWIPDAPFPESTFCGIAASPADDRTVAVACANAQGRGAPLVTHVSVDGGATWQDAAIPEAFQRGTGYLGPWPAFDANGDLLVAWADDKVDWSGVQDATWSGGESGRVMVAARDGATWRVMDIAPFPGRFGMLHACAGPAGTLGISVYATRDLTVTPTSTWVAWGLVSRDATSLAPSWSYGVLAPDPVSVGAYPPRDIQSCAFAPDGTMHVAFQHDRDEPQQPGDGIRADVLHAALLRP